MGRRSTVVAWSMLAVFVASYGIGIPLSVARGHLLQVDSTFLLAFAAFMAVGAVIVAHRPGNAVGWIFSAIGLLTATGMLAGEYAARADVGRPGALPGGVLAAWYMSWFWYPTVALFAGLALLMVSHALTPCSDRIAVWRKQLLK